MSFYFLLIVLIGLAFQILHCYPNLANSVNKNGLSPLHILASKPNVFRSSSRLSLFERIIYHCKNLYDYSIEFTTSFNFWINDQAHLPFNLLTLGYLNKQEFQFYLQGLIVDELVEKTEPPKAMEIFRGGSSTQNCPTNYETCVDFMRLLKTLFIKPISGWSCYVLYLIMRFPNSNNYLFFLFLSI